MLCTPPPLPQKDKLGKCENYSLPMLPACGEKNYPSYTYYTGL